MPNPPPSNGDIPGDSTDKEYLYSVLNLPVTATGYEIRDRYRQLSVLFHPDKQQDERTKETATKRFLEVQKAYQVLSDPVTRQAYDMLGAEGLTLVTSADFHGLSADEVKDQLLRNKSLRDQQRIESILRARGRLAIGIDASSLFERATETDDRSWSQTITDGISEIRQTSFGVRHTLQKEVSKDTTLVVSSRASRGKVDLHDPEGSGIGCDILGTVRHQYSPRLAFEASTSLLRTRFLRLKTTYGDDNNTFMIQTFFSPALLRVLSHVLRAESSPLLVFPLLPTTLAYSRRLFPTSSAQGTISISTTSHLPAISLAVSSAYAFDRTLEADIPTKVTASERLLRPPSRSGLAIGVGYWRFGATIAGLLPGLNGEIGITFPELGVQLKSVLQLGLMGLSAVVGVVWNGEGRSAGADVELSQAGVVLRLDIFYMNQRFFLPVVLSHEYNATLAFWTTLVPSTALVLAYHFAFVPLRRKRRMEFFRQARRELREAKSDLVRQNEETISLLQETAKRHTQTETAVDGLVILEAWYGPAERDGDSEGLDLNVTIPVQALVNKSQLYIPGRRTKAGLQGFYDPIPATAKLLRIRYTFRSREHYTEVPDFMPVVLPLEDHLVV